VGFPRELVGVQPEGGFYPVTEAVPAVFLGRGRWKGGGALHWFVDDYRQEFCWRRPQEGRLVASLARIVTAPDFTVWDDDPKAMREHQAWRSALVAAYWREVGVRVLPVISFDSGAERYVKPGSTWAVRGPSGASESRWKAGVSEFCDKARVARLVVFGRALPWLDTLGIPLELRRLQPATKEG